MHLLHLLYSSTFFLWTYFHLEDALRYALLGIGLGTRRTIRDPGESGLFVLWGRWSEVGIFFTFLVDLANKKCIIHSSYRSS